MGFRAAQRRLTGLFIFVGSVLVAAASFGACAEDRIQLRGDWGMAAFTVEIADTPRERSRGLMFRESMPRSSGMLFVYDRPQRVSFWMRNTPLSLDLLFFDRNGRLVRIHREAIPFDETAIPGGDNILAVLEINGGLSDVFGFQPGDEAQHPAFDAQLASWSCLVD